MKIGIYYLLLFIGMLSSRVMQAQCENGTRFPDFPVSLAPTNASAIVQTITTCNFTSEYFELTNVIPGKSYTVRSDVTTDWLTVRTGAVNGPVLAQGTTPLMIIPAGSSNLFVHVNLNAACGVDFLCRTTSVQCTNCCTLTCPANITVSKDPNQCGAVVNFPGPGTLGNCGTITATPSTGSFFPLGTTTVNVNAASGYTCAFTVTVNNTITGAISGTVTAPQHPATNSSITFTGSGGQPNYTFTYDISVNGGAYGTPQTIATSGGQSTVTVSQSHIQSGTFTYRLLSITESGGCAGSVTAPTTATVTVTPGTIDLTSSQFFTTLQIAAGANIDEVVVLRNVGTAPTAGTISFSITNYSALTGLTVSSNGTASVTIGIDTYSLDNSNWVFNSLLGTFTSSTVIPAGGSRNIGVRITRATAPVQGANGTVTQTTTISLGTGGGETPGTNNSISNTLLKN